MDIWLAVFLITYVIKNLVTDTAYAVRGQTPPRVQYKLQRLAAASNGRPPRYGAQDYLRDLYHDAWEDARERRVRKRATKKQPSVDTAAAAGGGGVGVLAAPAVPPKAADRITLKDPPPAAGGLVSSVVHDDHTYCLDPTCERCKRYGWRCPGCGAWDVGYATEADARAALGRHTCKPTTTSEPDPSKQQKQQEDSPGDVDDVDAAQGSADETPAEDGAGSKPADGTNTSGTDSDGPLATVHPLPIRTDASATTTQPQSQTQLEPLKEVAVEVTGLTSAIAYAEGMAKALADNTSSTENWKASLESPQVGVGGRAITIAALIVELQNQLASLWQEEAAELSKQLTVREAYNAVDGAGTREFVTSE